MTITKTIFLDFANSTQPIIVFAKQDNNNTRIIEIIPLNNGVGFTIDEDVSVMLQLTKADGHVVQNECEVVDNKIYAKLTYQCLSAPGITKAEIGLFRNDDYLSSQTFLIDVEESAFNKGGEESKDEYKSPFFVQSDWLQTDDSQKDFIKNKPTVDAVPTENSLNPLSSDAGYKIKQDIEELKNDIPLKEVKPHDDIHYIYDGNSEKSSFFTLDTSEGCFIKIADLIDYAAFESIAGFINFNVSTTDKENITAGQPIEVTENVSVMFNSNGNVAYLAYIGVECSHDNPLNIDYGGVNINFYEKGLYGFCIKHSEQNFEYVSDIIFKSDIKPLDEKFMPESYEQLKSEVAELRALVESLTNAQGVSENDI